MNRDTRDKMVSGTDQSDLTTGNACWETPPTVFAKLNEDFGPFDIDLTADDARHLCEVYFGQGPSAFAQDALSVAWHRYGQNGYSNPPYGAFIQRMLMKAKEECRLGFTSTLLLPMRVTKAFKAHVLNGASELLFCDSRLTFFESGIPRLNVKQFEKGKAVADPALFDSIIVRYQARVSALRVGIWHVPKHVLAEDLARAFERRRLKVT